MFTFRHVGLISAACLVAGSASAKWLAVANPDSPDDVWLFDAFDGSLIEQNFLDLDSFFSSSNPFIASQVNNEIWVSDNNNNRIDRFTLGGSYIGTDGGFSNPNPESITDGIGGPRGMTQVGNSLYVVNTSRFTGPGEDTMSVYDTTTRQRTSTFDLRGEAWDVLQVGNQLYVGNTDADTIDIYDLSGVYQSSLTVAGLEDPRQLNLSNDGQSIFTVSNAFSGKQIVEFDLAGNVIDTVGIGFQQEIGLNNFSPVGIIELGNGSLFFTGDGGGIGIYDRDTFTLQNLFTSEDFLFVEFIVPTPGTFVLAGLAGVMGTRRRRSA